MVIADVPCMMPEVDVIDKVQFPQSAPDVWRSMAFQRSTVATINCTRTVPVLYVAVAEVPSALVHVAGIKLPWRLSAADYFDVFYIYCYTDYQKHILVAVFYTIVMSK